jgi:hypothetical protein
MKLTTDDRGRLVSSDLFRPKATFDATVQSDGSIRLVEVDPVPLVKPRRIDGRLRGADIQVTREIVAAAVRAGRDAR